MLARVSDDELLQRLTGRRIAGRSLLSLLELDLEGLRQAGLSDSEASTVSVVAEIARRHQPQDLQRGPIRDPESVVSLLGDLRRSTSAKLIVMLLDRQHRLLATVCTVESAEGCPSSSPAIVTKRAQRAGATSVIIAHNHPDGFIAPTAADIRFTAMVRRSFVSTGVDLADHVVVTQRDWFSFRRAGLLN